MTKFKTENIKSIIRLKNEFLISWHTTGWCNFHCPYCVDGRDKTPFTKPELITDIAKSINKFIINNIPEDKKVRLRLYGGEPSYYNWIEILDEIKHLNTLVLPTNFSRDINYYKDLYDYCKSRNVLLVLNCSKHAEAVNYDNKIIELTKWCLDKKYMTPILTFVVNDNFNFKQLDYLKDNGIDRIRLTLERDLFGKWLPVSNNTLNLVREYNETYENKFSGKTLKIIFTDNTSSEFTNTTDFNNLMSDGGFNPDGYLCDTGMNNIAIWENGDVCYNRCELYRDKIIGNILTDDIKLNDKPIICTLNKSFNTTEMKCHLCHNNTIWKNN